MRVLIGELVKDGDRYKYVACKSSPNKFSGGSHSTAKKTLNNVNGISEDVRNNNTTTGYFMICSTRDSNKNKHNESVDHEENVKQKNPADKKWRVKVNELGLDYKMKF